MKFDNEDDALKDLRQKIRSLFFIKDGDISLIDDLCFPFGFDVDDYNHLIKNDNPNEFLQFLEDKKIRISWTEGHPSPQIDRIDHLCYIEGLTYVHKISIIRSDNPFFALGKSTIEQLEREGKI